MAAESLWRAGLDPVLHCYLSLPVSAGQEAPDLPLLSHLTHVHPQLSTSSVATTVDFRDVVGVIDILAKNETMKKTWPCWINPCGWWKAAGNEWKGKVSSILPQSVWSSHGLPPSVGQDPNLLVGAGLCSGPSSQGPLSGAGMSTKPFARVCGFLDPGRSRLPPGPTPPVSQKLEEKEVKTNKYKNIHFQKSSKRV